MNRFFLARLTLAAMCIVMCIALAAAQKAQEQREEQREKESNAVRKNNLADAALANVPDKARARTNPFENDPQAIAAGGKLFEQHCAECHGEKAGGIRPGTSLLRDPTQQAAPGTLFWIITNGVVRHGMPVWSKLPEPERWQIVTFLKTLHPQSMPPK
jgi:mono/diheme cytochrome c family protein